MMKTFRYSEWDGSQDLFDLDADELMDELGQNLMSYGDLSYSLRMMQRGGYRDSQGRQMPSIQELLQRLRQRRQNQLDKYNLGSMIDEIKQKLDDIIKTEREGIDRKLEEARKKAEAGTGELPPDVQERLLENIEERATQNLERLDSLPPDPGGRIKELSEYDFMDEEARRQFQELMDILKKQAMETYARDLVQQFKNMDSESLAAIRHMIEALNQMLEKRMRGEDPDFEGFMQQFGSFFGPNPPKTLDELIERLQKQIAQAQSLLDSMSPEDREALQDVLQSMLDQSTQYEMAKLAANLDALFPNEKLRRQYPFSGKESIPYSEALKLMETLQRMDELERQFRESQYNRTLDDIDEQMVKDLLGNEALEELERLRSITKTLEEAGYIRMKDGKYELTPSGMRKIGQKALEDIFMQLKKDRLGGHTIEKRGTGGERLDETKKYEFGDEFQLHLQKTIMNSIQREPGAIPVKLSTEDFEIYRTEDMTRTATILALDMSLSMPRRGNFEAAKRVTLALDNLIRTQYPKDSLYIIGFSSYARQVKKEDVTYMSWDDFDPYTNMQHGLILARKLLDKENCTNKQIILITDGEPTAHFENGHLYFQFPPSLRTIQ